ncbi:nucleotidyl transferase AbiEii/AbiGii toxin family protein [Corynebacterium sp. NPDC060344]|uniref:nucleotidyl transferase AbiEii/AbiGii toxin family protein n=1 Tax=Corynebacterium sp. NPDC060344 TaxID=3347101 RepID=UPI0036515989
MTYASEPSNLSSLNRRCNNLEGNDQLSVTRRQNLMALVVVGQLLPEGVAKGGSAMALRYGAEARFTSDFDATRRRAESEFKEQFANRLEEGWCGFTGVLKQLPAPVPRGVPGEYVMTPFEIKLQFRGKSWKTVKFELGHDEVGGAEAGERMMSEDLAVLFTDLGFPEPGPVKVMRAENQIAQKLHAATCPGSDRAHDLIDLQLLLSNEDIDFVLARELCVRTFRYRRGHAWPPKVTENESWKTVYEAAADELGPDAKVGDLSEAITWTRRLIDKIDRA